MAAPPRMRGQALQQLMRPERERPSDWPQEVFLQISEDHIGRAIRTTKWKYEVWVPSNEESSGGKVAAGKAYEEYHLYDLESDPHERHDLVGDSAYAQVRARLAETLKTRMVEGGEEPPEIRPAAGR